LQRSFRAISNDSNVESSIQPAQPWGTGRVIGGIGLLLVIVTFEAAIIAAFGSVDSLAAKLVLQSLLAVTLVGVAFGMASTGEGLIAPAKLGLRRPQPGAVGDALTVLIGYFGFALAYSAIANPHQKDITRDLGFGHNPAVSTLVGLLIVLAAPISEEIFFRGFVFGGFRNRMHWLAAAVLSAVIFGAFHYTGASSLAVLPQLAVLGFGLAWLYQRTGSIYPTMALHILNNTIAFIVIVH
jgi:membrane protease YdiL (CAAX protease family)